MDLQTLRTTVRRILFDQAAPSASRWSDDDLNGFFNEALLEVSRAARRLKTQDFTLTASSDSFILPQDFLKTEVILGRDSAATSWSRIERAEDPYPLDDQEYNNPLYWMIGNNVVIRPVPEADYVVRLVYFYKFPDLTTDTDVPEPDNVDGILIAYAMWQALDFDGSPLAQVWEKKFVQKLTGWGVAEMKRNRRRPAQVNVNR